MPNPQELHSGMTSKGARGHMHDAGNQRADALAHDGSGPDPGKMHDRRSPSVNCGPAEFARSLGSSHVDCCVPVYGQTEAHIDGKDLKLQLMRGLGNTRSNPAVLSTPTE